MLLYGIRQPLNTPDDDDVVDTDVTDGVVMLL